jgi:hypothetical protein
MSTFIDHVRCGVCDAGLTLEATSVVVQRYRRQPWIRHFWVLCDVCAAHKLYWPTTRQVRLADQLHCPTAVDDAAPDDVFRSYARSNGLPATDRRAPLVIPNADLGFLLSMLAATTGLTRAAAPVQSYLPAHWAN